MADSDTFGVFISDRDNERHYTRLSNFFLRAPGLSQEARLLYAILRSYCRHGEDQVCYPSEETLARDLGNVSTRTVRRGIAELIEAKSIILHKKRDGGRWPRNMYEVLPPQDMPHVVAYVKKMTNGHKCPSDINGASPSDINVQSQRTKMSGKEDVSKKEQIEEQETPSGVSSPARKRASKPRKQPEPVVEMTPLLEQLCSILPGVKEKGTSLDLLSRTVDLYPSMDHLTEARKCRDYHGDRRSSWAQTYVAWCSPRTYRQKDGSVKQKQFRLVDGSTGVLADCMKPLAAATTKEIHPSQAPADYVPPMPPDYIPSGVLLWDELIRYTDWLSRSSGVNIMARDPHPKLHRYIMPVELRDGSIVQPPRVTLTLAWQIKSVDGGLRQMSADPKDNIGLHDDFANIFQRVAKKWLKTNLVIEWADDPRRKSTSAGELTMVG